MRREGDASQGSCRGRYAGHVGSKSGEHVHMACCWHRFGPAARQRRARFAVTAAEVSLQWPRRLPLGTEHRRYLVALPILGLQCQRRRYQHVICLFHERLVCDRGQRYRRIRPHNFCQRAREDWYLRRWPEDYLAAEPVATLAARNLWRRSRAAADCWTKPHPVRHQGRRWSGPPPEPAPVFPLGSQLRAHWLLPPIAEQLPTCRRNRFSLLKRGPAR